MSASVGLAADLVVGLAGPWPTPREQAWLARYRPGGVILFARNTLGPHQLAALCARLHDTVPGLEIMADHEGGPVAALAAAAGRPPAAWGLGLLADADLTRRVHRDTALRLAALGVDRVLAPVADVLSEPRNPVIGVRAFGGEAGAVGRQVAAAVEGLREGGCRVCLKHWPGHGGSTTDSHREASVLAEPPADEPFRAGLAAGADAVMVGHLSGPRGLPATLDPDQAAAARSLTGGAPLLLLADDVTMGGLRPALAARGIAVPAGEGMAEPGDLDGDWLAALADGGCDRLLIRGVPWRAYPEAGESALPGPPEAGPSPRPPASWDEARQRLADRLPVDLASPPGKPGWLDRTAGDRWGPADGASSGLLPDGPGGFAGTAATGCAGVQSLLVTAHRPLDRGVEAKAGWLEGLALRGVAVAVGHPALVGDLTALLPEGWEVHGTPEWPLGSR